MAYRDKYKDCKGCPVRSHCKHPMGNSKVICETMPTKETLDEEWAEIMETGIVDPYDCC